MASASDVAAAQTPVKPSPKRNAAPPARSCGSFFWFLGAILINLTQMAVLTAFVYSGHLNPEYTYEPAAVATRIEWSGWRNWAGSAVPAGFLGEESMAELNDFPGWADLEGHVDFAEVLATKQASITPYCLDLPRKRVIFVEVDPADLERAISKGEIPFVYQAQRKYAKAAYGVPFADVAALADELAAGNWDADVLLLQSTGRCGSTLFSKLVEQSAGVRSLSEPDIYTEVAVRQLENPGGWSGDVSAAKIVRFVTWVLRQQSKAVAPDASTLLIKTRSQVVYATELLKEGLPESKSVFLYRNPVDTIDSYAMAFFSNPIAKWFREMKLDSYLLYNLTPLGGIMHLLAPLVNDKEGRFPEEVYKPLGILGFNAMGYISNMDKAVSLINSGEGYFQATIRYEELVRFRASVVKRALQACGIELATSLEGADADKVFDEDAHTGGNLQSARRKSNSKEPLFIQKEDFADLQVLLAAHVALHARDYFLLGGEPVRRTTSAPERKRSKPPPEMLKKYEQEVKEAKEMYRDLQTKAEKQAADKAMDEAIAEEKAKPKKKKKAKKKAKKHRNL